ncbi:MAG: hypothetical protein KAY32_11085 [Candidatus Eisenbacteria sp.]|nr:hypothetical protein [Candidatus Eisenbacteria bacterium]
MHRPEPVAIPYTKWSGAGNTFLFVESVSLGPEVQDRAVIAALARQLCRDPAGPGADGLFWIRGSEASVYNADGSTAAFCGNGARCLVAHLLARTGEKRVAARVGDIALEGWREGERIAITLPAPRFLARELPLALIGPLPPEWPGTLARAAWIEAGVPHLCVQFWDPPLRSLPSSPSPASSSPLPASSSPSPHLLSQALPPERLLIEVGGRLRRHGRFEPAGTNVDFVWTPAHAQGSLGGGVPRGGGPGLRGRLRTYERGVEGITRACGSGAVAAGALLLEEQACGSVVFTVASGDGLEVEKAEPAWILRGPADPLERGVFRADAGGAARPPPSPLRD